MTAPVAPSPTAGAVQTDPAVSPVVASNPSMPLVSIRIFRVALPISGTASSEELLIQPLTFSFKSSCTELDSLEITLPDPSYYIINHVLLLEDFLTHAEISFGYAGSKEWSEPTTLVFFRQKPSFSEHGVTTTLTFYDKGIFLSLPHAPMVFAHPNGMTTGDMVRAAIKVTNEMWNAGLDTDAEWQGMTFQDMHWRMPKPANMSFFQFLYYLKDRVMETQKERMGKVEIFVRNHTLFYRERPVGTGNLIGVYAYHSIKGGQRLISFEPEVSLRPQWERVPGIDTTAKTPVDAQANAKVGKVGTGGTTSLMAKTVGSTGATTDVRLSQRNTPGGPAGDAPSPDQIIDVADVPYTASEGDDLSTISEKNSVSLEELATLNGIDPDQPYTIVKGQVLKLPKSTTDAPTAHSVTRWAAREYVDSEDHAIRARAVVMGSPKLVAGFGIQVEDVGNKWSGIWWIADVDHKSDENGYLCELSLSRDGVPIQVKGVADKSDDVAQNPVQSTLTPAQQDAAAARTASTLGETGTTTTVTTPVPVPIKP